MKKATMLLCILLGAHMAMAQHADVQNPVTRKNNIKVEYNYHLVGLSQQSDAFSKTVGNEIGIEYNRSLSQSFDVGARLAVRDVTYATLNPQTLRADGSGSDLAFAFGANAYYHFLPVPDAGRTGWNGYAAARAGLCIADKVRFEYSLGIGTEYFITPMWGLFVETGWGNPFFMRIGVADNPAHLQLHGGVTVRF